MRVFAETQFNSPKPFDPQQAVYNAAKAERITREVRDRSGILPKNSARSKGKPLDPRMETLYAQLYESIGEAEKLFPLLSGDLAGIEQELRRIHKSAGLIAGTRNALHHASPRKDLSEAEEHAISSRQRLVDQMQQTRKARNELEAALHEARQKKWPGGTPRKNVSPPAMAAYGDTLPGAIQSGPGFGASSLPGREAGNLVSLGRIGGGSVPGKRAGGVL